MNVVRGRAILWTVFTIGLVSAACTLGQARGGGRGAAAPPAAAPAAPAAPAASAQGGFPDGPGKAEVTANCGGCHGLDQVAGAKHSPADWTETVKRMVTYGADLKDPQVATIAEYLGKNFSNAPAAGAAPDKDALAAGQKILETACTTCHDLGPVQRRADDKAAWESVVYGMIGNGADVKDADVPTLVNYLVYTYGPPAAAPAGAARGAAPAPPAGAPAGRGGRGARGQ